MSEAQAEAAFDESVFDAPAEEAKPDAAAAPALEAEKPKAADPKAKIEEIAKKIGHAGKDDWKGDPADWLDAPEFILKAAGEVLPSMRKSLEKANEEIAGLKKAVQTSIAQMSKAEAKGRQQALLEIQDRIDAAASAGDVQAVRDATDELVDLSKEDVPAAQAPTEPPELTAWKADNPWFGTDKPLTAAAIALGNEVFEEGYSGKAQAKEVDRRLREQFPDKFKPAENPNRRLPGTVEGGGGLPRRGGKSFSDMPKDNQEMCLELMKQSKAITKENYAKNYFAEDSK